MTEPFSRYAAVNNINAFEHAKALCAYFNSLDPTRPIDDLLNIVEQYYAYGEPNFERIIPFAELDFALRTYIGVLRYLP